MRKLLTLILGVLGFTTSLPISIESMTIEEVNTLLEPSPSPSPSKKLYYRYYGVYSPRIMFHEGSTVTDKYWNWYKDFFYKSNDGGPWMMDDAW